MFLKLARNFREIFVKMFRNFFVAQISTKLI